MRYLAIDLGASSGRIVEASFDGEKLNFKEIHRFPNDPVSVGGSFHWDILRLLFEIRTGLRKAALSSPGAEFSVGIDTWGVDYGWLDKSGRLLSNPYHYRDTRTRGTLQALDRLFPDGGVYERTGIQQLELNTLNQLLAERQQDSPVMACADKLLFIPDLLNYFLTGVKACEYTIASTGSLLNARTGKPDTDILDAIGLSADRFADPVLPGTPLADLSPDLQDEFGSTRFHFQAVASHDTASAVFSVPFETTSKGKVYLSSGTWSLMGCELDAPLMTKETLKANFTNEGGVCGTIRFLKNIMGLWLLQESRRQWQREGSDYSFSDLDAQALSCPPLRSLIDPDDPRFSTPGNMPRRIRDFCTETGQPVPETVGQTVRCILDSLSLKYRETVRSLEGLTGEPVGRIHVVGGGIQNRLLCRATADACERPVTAGPVEATACGNILSQMLARKEVSTLFQARDIVRASFGFETYDPDPAVAVAFSEAYERFRDLKTKS